MALKMKKWNIQDHIATPDSQIAYLQAAFEDNDPGLIAAAIGDVARARGASLVARQAGLSRETLYKGFVDDGNPTLSTIMSVLNVLGMQLKLDTISSHARDQNTTVTSKITVTAVYDNRDLANVAALALQQVGVLSKDVTVFPETAVFDSTEPHTGGFLASLESMFEGSQDRDIYAEVILRGGAVLAAHVGEGQLEAVVGILEHHGSVELEPPPMVVVNPVIAGSVARAPMRAAIGDVLQVAEEQPIVNKRLANRSKVSIRSYVVETPVTEMVSLLDKAVTVNRRRVDRSVTASKLGTDAFRDRTIEVEQIDEEAVIGKTIRVVEEIGIRKAVTDRVEMISDTVRSIKVEDSRIGAGVAAALPTSYAEQVTEDMEVVGTDGQHVGQVDYLQGNAIRLKKLDPAANGQHHFVPLSWVDSVDTRVTLKTSAAEAKSRWTVAR